MITTQNYYDTVNKIGIRNLPDDLKKLHELTDKVTHNGKDWSQYENNPNIKRVLDKYFERLASFKKGEPQPSAPAPVETKQPVPSQETVPATPTKIKATKKPSAKKEFSVLVNIDNNEIIVNGKTITVQKKSRLYDEYKKALKKKYGFKGDADMTQYISEEEDAMLDKLSVLEDKKKSEREEKRNNDTAMPVERMDEDVRFIKRYVGLHDKVKTGEQLLNFIKSLQRAILERRIRKTSSYAKEIAGIQQELIRAYNAMKGRTAQFNITPETLNKLLPIAHSEKPMLSIAYIKRYVGLHGKKGVKEKAKKLFEQIEQAVKYSKITTNDKYFAQIQLIKKSLRDYLKSNASLEIHHTELNGLMGILGCCCKNKNQMNGLGAVNSENFVNKEFETLGFKGQWRELLGDPAPGFTALVYGNPKGGKSSLALLFAKYLAENFGKVLFVAAEEGYGYTLQEKIERLHAKHPNLFVIDKLPNDLSAYQFVFIDSITKLGFDQTHITQLKKRYPKISFVFIAQVTKEGNFRGSKEIEHEVDVVVNVQNGLAKGWGRFNQGGVMKIF